MSTVDNKSFIAINAVAAGGFDELRIFECNFRGRMRRIVYIPGANAFSVGPCAPF